MQKKAIYPGTFDPITFGHLDIIKRAADLFETMIIAIAKDTSKNPLFTTDERLEMARQEVKNINANCKIEVAKFEGLLVDFAQKNNATVIVRGLRAVSDFEYEFQMFGMNSKLNPQIQTIFLPASEHHHFIASRFVKEVAKLGGDISKFVPQNIANKLYEKLSK
jgi:pantetheine-phosphate adenylyltransferase